MNRFSGKAILMFAGKVISTISAIMIFIQGFAPNEIQSKNLDFIYTILTNALPELLFLFVFGILISQSHRIYLLYKKNFFNCSFTKRLKYGIASVLFLFILFFIWLVPSNLYYYARARCFHYKNLDKAHRFHLYSNFAEDINEGHYISALNQLETIEKNYPEEAAKSLDIRNGLKMRIRSSKENYSQENFYRLTKGTMINKDVVSEIIRAYSLTPNEDMLVLLLNLEKTLRENLELTLAQIYIYKTVGDVEIIHNLIEKNGWFVINNMIWNNEESLEAKTQVLSKMYENLTLDEIEDFYQEFWYLTVLEKLRAWDRTTEF